MRTLGNGFKFQAGGRIIHDWDFFSKNQKYITNYGVQESVTRFRRVRFFMAGMLFKTIKFKQDIDVDGGEQQSLTIGINWELNHMPRVIYNFVHADFLDGTGSGSRTLVGVFRSAEAFFISKGGSGSFKSEAEPPEVFLFFNLSYHNYSKKVSDRCG